MEVKEAYQEKADAQLREWQAWIEQFKANPTLLRRDHRINASRAIQQLDDCYHLAEASLTELKNTRDESWDIAKEAVEQAMIILKRALNENGARPAGQFLRLQAHRSPVGKPFERKG
jgi:hypothetical protein